MAGGINYLRVYGPQKAFLPHPHRQSTSMLDDKTSTRPQRRIKKTRTVVTSDIEVLQTLLKTKLPDQLPALQHLERGYTYDFTTPSANDLEDYGALGVFTRRLERAFGYRANGIDIPFKDGLDGLCSFLLTMQKMIPTTDTIVQDWTETLIERVKQLIVLPVSSAFAFRGQLQS